MSLTDLNLQQQGVNPLMKVLFKENAENFVENFNPSDQQPPQIISGAIPHVVKKKKNPAIQQTLPWKNNHNRPIPIHQIKSPH